MVFYKITHNQDIIDVNTNENINYVRYDRYHQSLKICGSDSDDIIGIVSSDNSAIYHLVGYPKIPDTVLGEFIDVQMFEISEEDYTVFKKALEEEKEIIDPDPYIPPEPEPTPEEQEREEEYRRSLQFVKDKKIEYMSYLCHQTIENGILITLSDGLEYRFSLTENDQTNLMERQAQLMAGATQVSYHADGELCTYYSAEDMMAIIQASIFHKNYQTTYFNSLKYYINSMTDKNEVSAVEYGIEIPEQYQSQPLKDLLAQLAQLHINENQAIENQTIENAENEGDSNEVGTE
jgi:hypothetical protein